MTKLEAFLHFCELKLTGEQLREFWTARDTFGWKGASLSATAKAIYDEICIDPGMRDAAQIELDRRLQEAEKLRFNAVHALGKLKGHDRYTLLGDIQDVAHALNALRRNHEEVIAALQAVADKKDEAAQ